MEGYTREREPQNHKTVGKSQRVSVLSSSRALPLTEKGLQDCAQANMFVSIVGGKKQLVNMPSVGQFKIQTHTCHESCQKMGANGKNK